MARWCTLNTNASRPVKTYLEKINKAFESRVRLGIMSILVVNEWVDFLEMKDHLQVTDGNLASHIKALEKEKYLSVSKTFVDRKPNTKYKITEKGRTSFKKHIDALEQVIKQQK